MLNLSKITTFLVLLTFFLPAFAKSQEIVIKLDGTPEIFKVDKIGNVYVYQNRLLKKFSVQGQLLGQYSNFDKGNLHSIDVSDPFKLLLFYKDFNQLIFLDNKLTQLGNAISFDDLGFYSVSAICKSKQKAIWLFDDFENKLIKYSFNPKGIIQQINLNKTNRPLEKITFLLEHGDELYAAENDTTVSVFNQYGTKINELIINSKSDFQLNNKSIIYNNGHSVVSQNLVTGENSNLINLEQANEIRVNKNHVFLLKKTEIHIIDNQHNN